MGQIQIQLSQNLDASIDILPCNRFVPRIKQLALGGQTAGFNFLGQLLNVLIFRIMAVKLFRL